MPIYEYECNDCGERFEFLLRGEEQPACPSCGATRLVKQFSVPAAHSATSTQPSCPGQQTGPCGVSDCCRGCDLGGLMG